MHIGIDATCWVNPRGYGRVTRELVPLIARLAPDDAITCFVGAQDADRFDLSLPNVKVWPVALGASPTTAAAADGHRAVLDMLRLTNAVRRARLDVFFSPSVYTYFPLPLGLRAVVTVHDAIAERFPQLTLPTWRARLFWTMKVRLALWQNRLVVTDSEFAATDISRVLRIRRGRIRVAPLAPAASYHVVCEPRTIERAAARLDLPPGARWFVYVGGFNPHKNVDVLVRAHAALSKEWGANPPHLILVGPTEGDVFFGSLPQIRRTIEEEGTAALIRWAGFVPDDELRLLHAGAIALVLPSACEGFGLPAIEAAAAGTAVIATLESPLPELLAGGGIFVVPGDVHGLTAALRSMARDEPARHRMAVRAKACAQSLTWEGTARATLQALREAVA